MSDTAAKLAFAGQAFLSPEPAHLTALARELGDHAILEVLQHHPDHLELAYNNLFFNPAGTPCPPWQSAHGEEGRLMGDAHLRVLEWFRRHGIEPRTTNDPADHIGLILLFYSQLLRGNADPIEIQAFFRDHIQWIPDYCECVVRNTVHPFYRLLAERLSDWVQASLDPRET